ncbi:hypothetical protein [Tenacibaculum sp. IB213877]|uniref:hypothetical protein n=1 Tax=Tenacibaculum sp. IB213877 TaxID=3097351 RepID=UPI002A59CDF8|nr:hypothetical protein [Tenacibaculum sp. IB213877]MDY0780620.1 hypothetical protein [Tenacibaculum sp. IB213877]
MNSKNKNRGIVIFLLLLIFAIGFLSYQNTKDYQTLQLAFKEEKNELEKELSKIINDYDEVIDQKISISSNLRNKRNRVIQLRDSIKNLEEKNYNLIKGFRRRVSDLEKENRILFFQIDSLNEINSVLQVENVTVKKELDKQSVINEQIIKKYSNLKKSQQQLEEIIKKASVIEIDGLEFTAMKRKSNDKYTSTSRSNRTDAFKVSFNLLTNELVASRVKKIYISILDNHKNTISPTGKIWLKTKKNISYSKEIEVNFSSPEISLVSLIEVDRNHISEGAYQLNVYLEDKLIGNKVLELR